jgi:hypothetical protein
VRTELDHARTQEVLATQVTDYARLSVAYASRGDCRRAALAAWAADLRSVQSLLWASGISGAEDPDQQLLDVAGAVETALLGRAATGTSAREVVEAARQALLAAFDVSVHEQLRERFTDLDHLDTVRPPVPGAANQAVTDRLDGRGGEELVGDLLTAAADCRAVARVMSELGEPDEERRQVVSADLAGFEAFLVLASAASGDATLATTELRWDLAVAKLGQNARENRTSEGPLSSDALRTAMCAAVVPAEEQALLSVFDLGYPAR